MYFVNPLSPNIHIQILHTDFHRHFLIDKLTEFNKRSKHFLFVDHLIDSSATISLDNVWILFFFFYFFFYYYYFISTTSIDIHCSSTYSNIKITKKSYKIFDFKSRDSTFYKAIEKRGDVSSMQLICMTKQNKQILSQKQKGTRLK